MFGRTRARTLFKINSYVLRSQCGCFADCAQDNELEVPSSPVAKKKAAKQPASVSVKRHSAEANGRPRKKQKTESDESSEELSSPLSELDSASEPELKPKKTKKARKSVDKESSVGKKKARSKAEAVEPVAEEEDDAQPAGGQSDSELSVLIDEEPQPKKKGKREVSHSKPKTAKATKAKAPADEDPDQAEIKRLQGWLVKCGIRKLWGKELKPYDTPKAKIKHLKDMLSEVGMTGRYSQEKANQIKEARELAADIEAVQQGEERWGKGDKEDAEDDERPQRRLVRGAKNYDFLSSDGEETD